MSELRTDFKDEILQEGEEHRIYSIKRKGTDEIVESDIYLEKAYTPSQEGDEFGAKEVNEIHGRLNGLAPQNLLINGDFQIWQRGESFTIEGDEAFHYMADMWCVYASTGQTIEVNRITDGLQFSGATVIMQRMNPLEVGKNYIFLCKIDGDVKTLPIVGGTYIENDFLRYNKSGSYEQFQIKNNGITNVANARLWEGDIVYKIVKEDDAIALMRCQKFVKIITFQATGYCTTGGEVDFVAPFEIKMDSSPTISVMSEGSKTNVYTIVEAAYENRFVCRMFPTNVGTVSLVDRKVCLSCEPL